MVNLLFFILLTALIGGLVARFFKLPSLVGYILAGIIGGLIFSFDIGTNETIAELGVILLLFSVGIEISLEKLMKVGRIAVIGGILQIILTTAAAFWFMVTILNITPNPALVLALAFSFSSTALIVKIMDERRETETIHYQILTGWALVQDLAVIPIVVLLPTLAIDGGANWTSVATSSIFTTILVLGVVFLTGKLIAPYLTHLVAVTNSQELLILLAITLALGIAGLVSLFGISAAFGAFLAGVVISKTQENHAIFSETRPLRDVFSVLFFVSLGFLVSPSYIFSHLFIVILLTLFIVFIKIVIVFLLSLFLGYRGKTAVAVSLGLAQVGEFAFVLFMVSQKLGIMSPDLAQIGIAATLLSLLISPFLFKGIVPIWRELKRLTDDSALKKFFVNAVLLPEAPNMELSGHVVVAGFGRMGKWVGKALKKMDVAYVVVDYNHKTIHDAKIAKENVVYGDASFPEILDLAGISKAKAIIITVPDHLAQEEIIKYCKKEYPNLKIIARAHMDSDVKTLEEFNVDKIVQPEFEAAVAVVRSILTSSGKSKEEVSRKIKSLRLSHAQS